MRDIISSIPASASTAILLLLKEPQGEELGAIIKVSVRISRKKLEEQATMQRKHSKCLKSLTTTDEFNSKGSYLFPKILPLNKEHQR
jgi:1-aminocyclopropane-1-carboxylate deaminase/D-cysteine desulfhydrase-like pyridoxal-dependent ACC family enzyme